MHTHTKQWPGQKSKPLKYVGRATENLDHYFTLMPITVVLQSIINLGRVAEPVIQHVGWLGLGRLIIMQ